MPSTIASSIVAVVMLVSPRVAAQPGPPPPAPSVTRWGVYTEVSLGYAFMRGAETHWNGTYQSSGASLALARWSLGAQLRHQGLRAHLGGVLDVTEGVYSAAPTLGIELSVDGPLDLGTRLGARVAIARGEGNQTPIAFDGTVGMAGLRFRKPPLSLGVDAVHVWRDDGYATGMIASVGVSGRAGKYGFGVSVVGGIVIGLLVLAAAPRT